MATEEEFIYARNCNYFSSHIVCRVDFIFNGHRLFEINVDLFFGFGIGLCCLALLHDLIVFFKERKNKIFLENLFLSVARDYLKNKYNEDIEPYCVKMNFYQDFVAKTYINSGVVYLDEKMSEYVKISFNLTFSSLNIRDNLTIKREDELIRKLKTIAEEVEHTT